MLLVELHRVVVSLKIKSWDFISLSHSFSLFQLVSVSLFLCLSLVNHGLSLGGAGTPAM